MKIIIQVYLYAIKVIAVDNVYKGNDFMTIIVIFGTRPEAIKMCPLILKLKMETNIKCIVCLTGQHKEMLEQVMETFKIQADYNLSIMKDNQTLSWITTSILQKMDEIIEKEKPNLVLVHGDTTTSFSAALSAFYHSIPIGHVEAGLRTYDLNCPFPEEFNRQTIDILAKYYFTPTEETKKNLLKEKVDEGIEVRLLVDGMGSKSLKQKEIRYIKSLGIKFSIFFPGAFPRINTRINYRNHRKIVVIDGEIGYVGGFNVGNEYVNRGHQFKFWRDTHLKVKGQAVNELNKRFILDWDYASDENLDNIIKYFPKPKEYGDVGMQIVSSGPDHMDEYIKIAYMKIINNARKYVYIQTPYLVPDEPMLEALRISALSGVDVRIIVPGAPDHFFMEWVLSANIANLIDYGIKIYRYNNGFIHAKTIVSDDIVSSIGTANMDNRSFRLNFEVNAFIYDGAVAKQQAKIFLNDQKFSTFVTKESYEKRSRTLRIKESLIRLVAPIL